jgi:hypothetical protein
MITKLVRGGACAALCRLLVSSAVFAFGMVIAPLWLGSSAQAQVPFFPPSSFSSSSSSNSQQLDVNATNNAVRSSVESEMFTIHDWVRGIIALRRLRGGRPIGFAEEAADVNDPFEALGYAKSGQRMVTKAPPMAAPAASAWYVSAWGQGSADHESRDITFLGVLQSTRTTTFTGLGGVDVVKIGITTDSDAVVFGLLGSDSSTRTTGFTNTHSSTPGGGLYATYLNGGFSADFSFLANFTSTSIAGAVVRTDTDSYVATSNFQYKYDVPSQNWWVEPTVGFSYTRQFQHLPGTLFTDGTQTRFQGGVRFGTEWAYGTIKVQPTLMGLAYTDAQVDTPRVFGTLPVVTPTDDHYLWGKGTGKVNVQWTDKFSTYVEGEVRGRADVLGYAGRIAARYTF